MGSGCGKAMGKFREKTVITETISIREKAEKVWMSRAGAGEVLESWQCGAAGDALG